MAKPFPTDNPFLRGYYGPVNTEADADHLQITGEMPKELLGTLYRNGPNPQFAARGPFFHWFGGDGMMFFGYSAKGRFTKEVSIQTVDKAGKITRAEILEAPYPSMIHDFAVTRNWIVLPVFPLTGSMERAMNGKPPFAWEPDKGTHIAFIPRNGTVADVKWVSAPACYVFHPMNHYETADGKVVVDVMKYDVAPLFPLPDGSPSSRDEPAARLFRWTFDLSGQANTFKEAP